MTTSFAVGVMALALAATCGRQAYVGQASKHIHCCTPSTASLHHLPDKTKAISIAHELCWCMADSTNTGEDWFDGVQMEGEFAL